MFYIYEVITVDGLRYVGQTNNLSKRMSDHRCGRNSQLRRGDFKDYRVLDVVKNDFLAYLGEIYFIRMLEPELNIDGGGNLGDKVFSVGELKNFYDVCF